MAEKENETPKEEGKESYNPYGKEEGTTENIEMPDDLQFEDTSQKTEEATVIEEENKTGGDKKSTLFDQLREEGKKEEEEKKNTEGEKKEGETKEEATESDTGMSDEFAQFTAKWLVDVYCQTFCMFLKNYAKIDKKTVYEAILSGHLNERYLKFIDEANDKVDKGIVFTEEQKKFILEPLTRFVKVNKIKVPSGLQLLIGLGVMSGIVFMTANDMRKDNEFLLNKIILESQKIREEIRKRRTKEEPEFTVEDENSENQEQQTTEENNSGQEGENKSSEENNDTTEVVEN